MENSPRKIDLTVVRGQGRTLLDNYRAQRRLGSHLLLVVAYLLTTAILLGLDSYPVSNFEDLAPALSVVAALAIAVSLFFGLRRARLGNSLLGSRVAIALTVMFTPLQLFTVNLSVLAGVTPLQHRLQLWIYLGVTLSLLGLILASLALIQSFRLTAGTMIYTAELRVVSYRGTRAERGKLVELLEAEAEMPREDVRAHLNAMSPKLTRLLYDGSELVGAATHNRKSMELEAIHCTMANSRRAAETLGEDSFYLQTSRGSDREAVARVRAPLAAYLERTGWTAVERTPDSVVLTMDRGSIRAQ